MTPIGRLATSAAIVLPLLAQTAVPSSARAQETPALFSSPPSGMPALHVGHPDVSASGIKAYEAEFVLTAIGPDGVETPFGRWTDHVAYVTGQDSTRLLRREVARYTAEGEMDLWRVHTVSPDDMRPLITDQRFGPELRSMVRIEHDSTRVLHIQVGNLESPTRLFDETHAHAPFDLSLWAVLLLGFPREAGTQASFPVVGPTGQVGWETYSVEAGGDLALPNGATVSTQKVSTRFRPWTVWLSDQAPYIVRIEQRAPDGTRIISTRAR